MMYTITFKRFKKACGYVLNAYDYKEEKDYCGNIEDPNSPKELCREKNCPELKKCRKIGKQIKHKFVPNMYGKDIGGFMVKS